MRNANIFKRLKFYDSLGSSRKFIRHSDETKVTEQFYSPEATFNKIYI